MVAILRPPAADLVVQSELDPLTDVLIDPLGNVLRREAIPGLALSGNDFLTTYGIDPATGTMKRMSAVGWNPYDYEEDLEGGIGAGSPGLAHGRYLSKGPMQVIYGPDDQRTIIGRRQYGFAYLHERAGSSTSYVVEHYVPLYFSVKAIDRTNGSDQTLLKDARIIVRDLYDSISVGIRSNRLSGYGELTIDNEAGSVENTYPALPVAMGLQVYTGRTAAAPNPDGSFRRLVAQWEADGRLKLRPQVGAGQVVDALLFEPEVAGADTTSAGIRIGYRANVATQRAEIVMRGDGQANNDTTMLFRTQRTAGEGLRDQLQIDRWGNHWLFGMTPTNVNDRGVVGYADIAGIPAVNPVGGLLTFSHAGRFKTRDSAGVVHDLAEKVNKSGDTMTAPLLLSGGSLAAPGIAFAADTDTGFRQAAAGQMEVVIDGAARANFGSTPGVFSFTAGLWPSTDNARSLGQPSLRWSHIYGGLLQVFNGNAANIATLVRGAVSQSADVFSTQDSAGATGMGINSATKLKWPAAFSQTTVGAAGAASALPAQPREYLHVVTPSGLGVVPVYAAA